MEKGKGGTIEDEVRDQIRHGQYWYHVGEEGRGYHGGEEGKGYHGGRTEIPWWREGRYHGGGKSDTMQEGSVIPWNKPGDSMVDGRLVPWRRDYIGGKGGAM